MLREAKWSLIRGKVGNKGELTFLIGSNNNK